MEFDTIIESALVVDGTGGPVHRRDVAIRAGQIAAVDRLDEAVAAERVCGDGLVLCPGFVDVHSHADLSAHLEDQPRLLEPLVRQGITTCVGGNCGLSLAPILPLHESPIYDFLEAFTGRDQRSEIRWRSFGEYLETIEQQGLVLNMGFLAPHGIIRINAMGQHRRPAGKDELEAMKAMVTESLDAGALGLSTGLQYFPGSFSDTAELVALARVVHSRGGVFTSHLRSYSNTLELAIEEIKEISRRTGVPIQLSHLFWIPQVHDLVDPWIRRLVRTGARLYRRVKLPIPLDLAIAAILDRLGRDIDKGLPLGIYGMPTAAGFTHLLAFFPPWVLEDGLEKVLGRVAHRATRQRMFQEIVEGKSIWPHRAPGTWSMNFFKLMGWEGVYIMSVVSDENKHLEGMNLAELGRHTGKHPFEAACDLLLEENGRVLVFETFTRPGDPFLERSLRATMQNPNVSIVTDAIMLGYGRPSHLFYDCYPKYLSRYARDEGVVALQEAVRKCTSLPAAQLGILDRGRIEVGAAADLVLLDFQALGTSSTFEHPDVFPTGVRRVWINGRAVLDETGYHPEPRAGRIVRRGERP